MRDIRFKKAKGNRTIRRKGRTGEGTGDGRFWRKKNVEAPGKARGQVRNKTWRGSVCCVAIKNSLLLRREDIGFQCGDYKEKTAGARNGEDNEGVRVCQTRTQKGEAFSKMKMNYETLVFTQ